MLYPTVSDCWNRRHQSRTIAHYTEAVRELKPEAYEALLQEARDYNKKLASRSGDSFRKLTEREQREYDSLLDLTGTGVMGYIEIPKMNCRLAIGHGTGEDVLQQSAGHLPGSSLPVGGSSTHSVISGHRGLPSARLFSDLDLLADGDRFTLNTLGEVLTYEVDQILTVLPNETEALQIIKGKDLCTLVTCTPYGVNSHRLLVRGHRVAGEKAKEKETVATAIAETVELTDRKTLAAMEMVLFLSVILLGGYYLWGRR